MKQIPIITILITICMVSPLLAQNSLILKPGTPSIDFDRNELDESTEKVLIRMETAKTFGAIKISTLLKLRNDIDKEIDWTQKITNEAIKPLFKKFKSMLLRLRAAKKRKGELDKKNAKNSGKKK